MLAINSLRWAGLLLWLPVLACAVARQTPQPAAPLEQLAFEIQTATPTPAMLIGAPTATPNPNATVTPPVTSTLVVTSITLTATTEATATLAGVFQSAPTIPGHRYFVQLSLPSETSPAEITGTLGIDVSGGLDWQAETVQWFVFDQARLEETGATMAETVTATGETMTLFIKSETGAPFPLDSVEVVDLGPEADE